MKIIEALKELPLIEKKVEKTVKRIQKYAAAADNGDIEYPFGTAEGQRDSIKGMLQSVHDQAARMGRIRRVLALTNASTYVTINGTTLSITEWIAMRDRGGSLERASLLALNQDAAKAELKTLHFDAEKGIRIVSYYDEAEKLNSIDALDDMLGKIDAELEMVNATTDLVEEV